MDHDSFGVLHRVTAFDAVILLDDVHHRVIVIASWRTVEKRVAQYSPLLDS